MERERGKRYGMEEYSFVENFWEPFIGLRYLVNKR